MRLVLNIMRSIVLLFALLYLIMGMQWLLVPQNMSSDFAVLPNGILGWATLRADFGSFFIVAGVTAALAASNLRGANHYLVCCLLLMSTAALGRTIGFALDGVPEGGTVPFLFELATVAALVGLASMRNRVEKQEAQA